MSRPGRGFKRVTVTVYREQMSAAVAVVAKCPNVDHGSIRAAGEHLSFSLDLSTFPDGDALCVEGTILRDIERATKP